MFKLEHIALNVHEPAKLAQWYAANLDLTIVRSDAEAPYIHFVQAPQNGFLLEFYANPAGDYVDYANVHPLGFHIAFTVDDMDAAQNRLLAAGATAAMAPFAMANGDILCFLRDPWGVPIQLVQRVKPFAPID